MGKPKLVVSRAADGGWEGIAGGKGVRWEFGADDDVLHGGFGFSMGIIALGFRIAGQAEGMPQEG